MIAFVVYGQPAPAGSKTARHSGGRSWVHDSSKRSKPWQTAVASAAANAMTNARAELLDGPVAVAFTFLIPRPKGQYGTGRNAGVVKPSAPAHPTTRPDVLKLARAVEDACTGIVWRDDAQIVREVLCKRWGTPVRVEVEVTPL